MVYLEGDRQGMMCVPSDWIEGKFVRYPPSGNPYTRVLRGDSPDESWLAYEVRKIIIKEVEKSVAEQVMELRASSAESCDEDACTYEFAIS